MIIIPTKYFPYGWVSIQNFSLWPNNQNLSNQHQEAQHYPKVHPPIMYAAKFSVKVSDNYYWQKLAKEEVWVISSMNI